VQRTPLLKCYKVSFESDSTNILLSFQHHVVWCGALTPLVRTISTIGAEHQHVAWRWEEWFVMVVTLYV